MLAHLEARAIEGVEEIAGDAYRRTMMAGQRLGTVEVRYEEARTQLAVTVHGLDSRNVAGVLARVRGAFDIDTDLAAIGAHLSRDPSLARLVALRPGLRVPGGFDGFELAVRAILGQQ